MAKQWVEGLRSAVNFHVLVNSKLMALVEVESSNVINKLGVLLTQNAFKVRWTAGRYFRRLVDDFSSANKANKFSTCIPVCPPSRFTTEGMAILSCHNYWIVFRLIRGGSKPPFLAFLPLITMEDSSVPFRTLFSAILSVVKGGVIEASVFDDTQILNIIDKEKEKGFPSFSDGNDDLRVFPVKNQLTLAYSCVNTPKMLARKPR